MVWKPPGASPKQDQTGSLDSCFYAFITLTLAFSQDEPVGR